MALNDDDEDLDENQGGEEPEADPRAMLYQNLESRAASRQGLNAARVGLSDDMAKNQLYAALAQSASQMGSIGGKTASAAPVQGMAQGLDQAGAMQVQGLKDQAQEEDKDRDALMRFLQQKTMSEISAKKASDTADYRQKSLDLKEQEGESNRQARSDDKQDQRDFMSQQGEANRGLRMDLAKMGAQTKGDAKGAKLDSTDEKALTNIDKEMDPERSSSRTGLGKLNSTADASDRLSQLHQQSLSQKGGLDKRQIEEMAVASGNLVSGGSGSALAIVQAMVPHTSGNVSADIQEWLTNDPTGTNQQAFVDRMAETAQREGHLAKEKIKATQSRIMNGIGNQGLWNRHPELKDQIQAKYFQDQDNFDSNGNYAMQPYQQKNAITPAAGAGQALAAPAGAAVPSVPDIQAEMMRRGLLKKPPAAAPPPGMPSPPPAGFASPPPPGGG